MEKRNTSNNLLFMEIRKLEAKCLAAGKITKDDIKTSDEMRTAAWNIYLESRNVYLTFLLTGKGGRTMSEYPRDIIAAYAGGAITKEHFKTRFAAWQKAHGIDYDCKGTGGKGWLGLIYRGKNAVIKGGIITWICDEYRDPKKSNRRFIRDTAESVTEFKRKVDFAIRDRQIGTAWN